MAKYWQIRESYGDKVAKTENEAYECGYEDGYEAAMEEMGGSSTGMRESMYGMRDGSYGMRMGERRRRDSMGRYR